MTLSKNIFNNFNLNYLCLIFIQKIEWNEETATVSTKY